jgi:hypothetical protein
LAPLVVLQPTLTNFIETSMRGISFGTMQFVK